MGLHSLLNRFWIGKYAISLLHCVECKLVPLLIDDETAVKKFYKKKTGKDLDLQNPQTFSEKMNWYKLNCRNPLMQQCADKVGLRDYVKSKGYDDCLNEIYRIYERVGDIDISQLPDRFVLKAAHGSHMNLIVKDKKNINWLKERLMMRTWLMQDIAWSGREWVYKDMPKRIVAEKFIEDSTGELRDFKFFCFNGRPEYMELDMGRFVGTHYRNFYDMDLNLLPISCEWSMNNAIEVPIETEVFETMKKIASDLSEPFPFVRVDFYYAEKKVIIGEMTFFHNGGITWFQPEEYDGIFGDMWKIQNE